MLRGGLLLSGKAAGIGGIGSSTNVSALLIKLPSGVCTLSEVGVLASSGNPPGIDGPLLVPPRDLGGGGSTSSRLLLKDT